jgi:hypothetical protein
MTDPNPPYEKEVSPSEQKSREHVTGSRFRLTTDAYHEWASHKWVMYAAVTIRGKQLLMEGNMLGMYRVTIGSHVDTPRYHGPSLVDAVNAYNEEL